MKHLRPVTKAQSSTVDPGAIISAVAAILTALAPIVTLIASNKKAQQQA